MKWSEKQDETLLRLRSEGSSFSEIAALLGLNSRNQVAGRIYRLDNPIEPKEPAPYPDRTAWTEDSLTESWAERKDRMREQDFVNKEVMPPLRKHGHVSHVQNSAEDGTPDINYAIFPASGWIEAKVAKSGWLYFETFQIPWFRKRLRALHGNGVWVLARVDQEILLWSAQSVVDAPREPYRKWVRCKVADLGTPRVTLSQQGWAGIISALTDPSQFTSRDETL